MFSEMKHLVAVVVTAVTAAACAGNWTSEVTDADQAAYDMIRREIDGLELPAGATDERTTGSPGTTGAGARDVHYERIATLGPDADPDETLDQLAADAAARSWRLVGLDCDQRWLAMVLPERFIGFGASLSTNPDGPVVLTVAVTGGPGTDRTGGLPPPIDGSCAGGDVD